MKLKITLAISMLLSAFNSFSITQKDTIYAREATTAPVIDGKATEACWTNAKWLPIDQVWLGNYVDASDFSGKYKVSWDKDYLYLFVEITDDILFDDHPNPFTDYWTGDVVEVFIDENRSKGDHKCNYNAFAYHVSPRGKAIDWNEDCSPAYFNEHVILKVDTISEHTYNWEFAIKIYGGTYNPDDSEASRISLIKRKLMGLTIAYCDNDDTNMRENFIGSIYMTDATKDMNYITANYFGSLLLVDENYGTSVGEVNIDDIKLFPNPAESKLTVSSNEDIKLVNLISLEGKIVANYNFNNIQTTTINVDNYAKGLYYVEVISGQDNNRSVKKIVLK